MDEKGRRINLASGHVTAMLHGNGWQAHLTKNEFFSKYEVVPGPGNNPGATAYRLRTMISSNSFVKVPLILGLFSDVCIHWSRHIAPRAGYSAMVLCWDPSNHVPVTTPQSPPHLDSKDVLERLLVVTQCHGFDLVGALYTVLWVAGGALSGLLGRLFLVLI